jgi:hypothetical protein
LAPRSKFISARAPEAKASPAPGDVAPVENTLPAPNVAEQTAIDTATKRLIARDPRFRIELKQNEGGRIDVFGATHADHLGWVTRLEDTFGTRGQAFAIAQLNHILGVCRDGEGKYDVGRVNALIAAVEAAKPSNEIEASLAVQMSMTHELAMQALRRAGRVGEIPQYNSAGNMAVKLLRTYTMQVEALAKLQRGGQQVVKVVHVHAGGQAVVGTVTTGVNGPNGGGVSNEIDQRAHAKAELSAPSAQPMQEMWSEDTERRGVPVASGRQ